MISGSIVFVETLEALHYFEWILINKSNTI